MKTFESSNNPAVRTNVDVGMRRLQLRPSLWWTWTLSD